MIRKSALVLGLALLSSTALAGTVTQNAKAPGSTGSTYHIVKKVSDIEGNAPRLDRKLVNPWGLDGLPQGALWVADQGSDKATTYNKKTGNKLPTRINVPGEPTGLSYIVADPDGTGDFKISNNGVTERSFFAFATEGGQVLGWNPDVSPGDALVGYDGTADSSSYTGLTFAPVPRLLHAADFAHNRVIMLDGNWTKVGAYTDPNLPADYAPFGVRAIDGEIFVAFAKRDPATGDEVKGFGLGIVDVFNENGGLKRRLISQGGPLNAPWGLTKAPEGFGTFAGALLVGNFGDGWIHAFDKQTGAFLGPLTDIDGRPLAIDGLWGLFSHHNGFVIFSAGPNDEQDGLLGTIEVDSAGAGK